MYGGGRENVPGNLKKNRTLSAMAATQEEMWNSRKQ
jgi:hypothetical protein